MRAFVYWDWIIIHHKTSDTKIVIGNICIDRYNKKEVIFGKIDCSEFHTWIISLFSCINVIKKDNGTLEHFKKSKPFIEKCLNDRIITEEEKDKYEEYPKLYSMRNGVYTLLIENYSDLNIITSLFKKICDSGYLHPSRGEYKEKYEIENILFNENEKRIFLWMVNSLSWVLKQKNIMEEERDKIFAWQ